MSRLILPDEAKTNVTVGYVHGDWIAPAFMESVINLVCYQGATRYMLRTIVSCHGSRLTENRNNVVRRFLENGGDWLFFLDTDIQVQPNVLDVLLAAAAPDTLILAAPYWSSPVDGQERMTWHDPDLKPLTAIQSAGMLELGACGMGCTLIHRRVFETMRARWQNPDDPWVWFAHDLLPFGERAGEDVTFCLRAKAHGFATWGVADPIVEHHKLSRQPRRILTPDEIHSLVTP